MYEAEGGGWTGETLQHATRAGEKVRSVRVGGWMKLISYCLELVVINVIVFFRRRYVRAYS